MYIYTVYIYNEYRSIFGTCYLFYTTVSRGLVSSPIRVQNIYAGDLILFTDVPLFSCNILIDTLTIVMMVMQY